MSSSQKMLKIVSMVMLVLGVSSLLVALGFAGVKFLGGADVLASETLPFGMTSQVAGIVFAILAAVQGIVSLFLGLAGMRAANVPSKVAPVRMYAMVCMVLSALNVGLYVMAGTDNGIAQTVEMLCGLLCSVALFVLSNNVKKDYETWH